MPGFVKDGLAVLFMISRLKMSAGVFMGSKRSTEKLRDDAGR